MPEHPLFSAPASGPRSAQTISGPFSVVTRVRPNMLHARSQLLQGVKPKTVLDPVPPPSSNRAAASPTAPGHNTLEYRFLHHAVHGSGKLSPRGGNLRRPATLSVPRHRYVTSTIMKHSPPPAYLQIKRHSRPDPRQPARHQQGCTCGNDPNSMVSSRKRMWHLFLLPFCHDCSSRGARRHPLRRTVLIT